MLSIPPLCLPLLSSAPPETQSSGGTPRQPDQLLKIANALGISINLFMVFDIETVSDLLSLLFKLDEQVGITFEAEKNTDGNFDPSTLKLSFNNRAINKKLCTYLKAKQ